MSYDKYLKDAEWLERKKYPELFKKDEDMPKKEKPVFYQVYTDIDGKDTLKKETVEIKKNEDGTLDRVVRKHLPKVDAQGNQLVVPGNRAARRRVR